MAIGLVLFAKTPGYADPMSYLFGNILLVSEADVWLVLAMDFVVVALGLGLYPKLLAVCFDEQFAELRGLPVKLYYLLLLCLTGLTVVLLGARGGHCAGHRTADTSGGRRRSFRPAALADDAAGDRMLHGLHHRRNCRELPGKSSERPGDYSHRRRDVFIGRPRHAIPEARLTQLRSTRSHPVGHRLNAPLPIQDSQGYMRQGQTLAVAKQLIVMSILARVTRTMVVRSRSTSS